MQITKYPLPPLNLSEILDKAKDDHTHKCDDYCREDDGSDYCGAALCRRSTADNEKLLDVPVIVKIEAGHGRHIHDDLSDENGCQFYDYEKFDESRKRWFSTRRRKPFGCMADCDDSDWIVHIQYSREGWQAVYGVKLNGGIQDVQLWAD